MLKSLWERIRFNQKKEWDKIAYGYLNNSDNNGLILDVATGIGRFVEQNPEQIVGIDWNPKSVKQCKQKGYTVKKGDARDLPFQANKFSGVHCSHLIEHFLPEDTHKILKEMDRVLTKNGTLVIRSPLMWDKFYSDLTHVKPYNPNSILHYLTPSSQRTLEHISENYSVINLKWRYKKLHLPIKYLNTASNVLNRWGFPWLQRNGYMLVLQKSG